MTRPSLLYVVKQVELAVRARLDDLVRPAGMTALQYTALTVLEAGGSMTAASLARNSFVTTQTAADMVRALESRGLIRRVPDERDRRRMLISLTNQGLRVLAAHADAVSALEAEMTTGLSHSDEKALRAALDRCRSNLAGGAS